MVTNKTQPPKPENALPAASFGLTLAGSHKKLPTDWSRVPATYNSAPGTLDLEPLTQYPPPTTLIFTPTEGKDQSVSTGAVLITGNATWGQDWPSKVVIPLRTPRQLFLKEMVKAPQLLPWLALSNEQFWQALNTIDTSTKEGKAGRDSLLQIWAMDRATRDLEQRDPTLRSMDAVASGFMEDGTFMGWTTGAIRSKAWVNNTTDSVASWLSGAHKDPQTGEMKYDWVMPEEMLMAYYQMHKAALVGTSAEPGYELGWGYAGTLGGLGAGIALLAVSGGTAAAPAAGARLTAAGVTTAAAGVFSAAGMRTVLKSTANVAMLGPGAFWNPGTVAAKVGVTSATGTIAVEAAAGCAAIGSTVALARTGQYLDSPEQAEQVKNGAFQGCAIGGAIGGAYSGTLIVGQAVRNGFKKAPQPAPAR